MDALVDQRLVQVRAPAGVEQPVDLLVDRLDHGRMVVSEVEASDTGAEVEQVVVAARYSAQARGQRLDQDLLQAEIKQTRPLSVVMAERVADIREWARDRTVSAD